ncbi:MAG: PD40 domain-containing protein [Gemmatimonadota bacterium]|nr:MAG: PD40 domain-containing protein [Gemmatimonadota bacterium]
MGKHEADMKTMVLFLAAVTVVFSSLTLSFSQTGPYLGQEPPGMEPVIFVPESLRSNADWFWHGAPAFTPDLEEFYLDIYMPADNTGIQVRFMEMIENVWTSPEPPAFTGSAEDASPSFTDNGNKVFFISDRPGGSSYGVWSATRTETGWSTPSPINIPYRSSLGGGWRVSVTRDETLYMRMHDFDLNTDMDIYRVRKMNGSYSEPERLDDNVNSSYMDLGAFIDPDESYIIFASIRPGGYGNTDLYISFRRPGDSWTPAVNMGEPVNSSASEGSPYVSPDGLYFFFLSNREPQYGRNPYWVSAQVIENLRPDNTCCECADCSDDGSIDIIDALWEVNCILGLTPPPCSCDCNQDGSDDVLDVLCIVNIILEGSCP